MLDSFRYKAFISYSHADEREARRLHRSLEGFRLPRQMTRNAGESRIGKVFRDRDELASATSLSDEIRRALAQSEFLIVVCSRASRDSKWVDQEIRHFVHLRGVQHVLTYITAPFEAFPPAIVELLGSEPLAGDGRAEGDGRNNASLKLIAGMLDVPFDDLVQRQRTRRRRTMAIQAGTLASSMAVAGGLSLWIADPEMCPDPEPRFAGIWDERVRGELAGAYADSDLSFATSTLDRAFVGLGAYTQEWRSSYVDACEATHERGSQSDTLLDQRMLCLDGRLFDLQALVEEMRTPDSLVVQNTVDAVNGLPSVAACDDTANLSVRFPPPSKAERPKVAQLEQRLSLVRAAVGTGQYRVARERYGAIASDVAELAYPPLSADAGFLYGRLLGDLDDPLAIETLTDAAVSAAEARDDVLASRTWSELLIVLTEGLGDLDRVVDVLPMARAASARSGPAHPVRAVLLNAQGALAYRRGELSDAMRFFEQAIDADTDGDYINPHLVTANIANVLLGQAQYQAAAEVATRALRNVRNAYGRRHPRTAQPMMTLAGIALAQGDRDLALQTYREVLDITEESFGHDTTEFALVLRGIGWTLKEDGQLDQARRHMEESMAIDRSLNVAGFHTANLYNALGDLAVYMENLDAAEQHFRDAVEVWEQYGDNPGAAVPLSNLGGLLARLGRYEEAVKSCTRARILDEAALRPDHPDLAYSYTCIGEAYLGLGKLDDAHDLLSQAVRLRAQSTPWELAVTQFQLGRTFYAMGKTERGRSMIQQAQAALVRHGAPDPYILHTVANWLDQH